MALTIILYSAAVLLIVSALSSSCTTAPPDASSSTAPLCLFPARASSSRSRSYSGPGSTESSDAAPRPAVARRAFPPRRALGVLPARGQSRRRAPRASTRSATASTRRAPQRVLPFYPAFLAGMNLVVLADDAFTFLFAWEFMSLSSWALVMAHHRAARTCAPATSISSWRASARSRCCSPSACWPGRTAAMPSPRSARSHPDAASAALVLMLALDRRRLQGRPGAAARLAAARASGGAEPRLGADERRHDQGRGLRASSASCSICSATPAWWWSMVVLALAGITARDGRALRADAARPEAAARLSHGREYRHHLHRPRPGARPSRRTASAGPAALALTAALLHVFNHSLFKSLLFFGAGAVLTATGERDMEHLGGLIHRMPLHRLRVPGRLRRDLGAAAAQRLRLGMADLPGDPAQPAAAAMGPEVPGPGGRRAARAVGGAGRGLLRQGLRHHLSRPAAHARPPSARTRPTASRSPRCSRSPALCLAGGHPARLLHRCARAGRARHGRRAHAGCSIGVPWLSIVPIAESRSSYNGLLVFLFMLLSASLRRVAHPSFGLATGCAARRRPGIAAIPTRARDAIHRARASPSRSAACSARWCSARARRSTCRRPATMRPARLAVAAARSRLGRALCADRAAPSTVVAERLNRLQFLTIRRYLSWSSSRWSSCSWCWRYGPDPRSRRRRARRCCWCWLLAPLLIGFVRKVKARLLRRQRAAADAALSRSRRGCCARRWCWPTTPPGCSASAPYLIFAATWVAAALVPTFATGLMFSWSADLIAIIALLGSARFFLALAGMDVGTSFGGIGSSREMMIASLAEPAMLMIVFTLALLAGSTQLSTIAGYLRLRRGRLARLARAGAGRADHGGDRRERAHPGRQSRDASRADHGARGDGARIFRPAPRADRARRPSSSCCSTSR